MTGAERNMKVFLVASGGPNGARGIAEVVREGQPSGRRSRTLEGSTPNQAILTAASHVLEQVKPGATLTFICDVEYLTLGIIRDLPLWRSNGWKKAGGGKIANADLWQRLDAGMTRHTVTARRSENAQEEARLRRLKQVLLAVAA